MATGDTGDSGDSGSPAPAGRTLQWDAAGQLVGLTEPDGTTWAFAYDALGRRVHVEETLAGSTAAAVAATGVEAVLDGYSYNTLVGSMGASEEDRPMRPDATRSARNDQ